MMRARRRDAGISMILVVILVFITIILAVAAILYWGEYKDRQRQQQALLGEEIRLRQEEEQVKEKISRTVDATGFSLEGAELPISRARQTATDERKKWVSLERLNALPLVKGEKSTDVNDPDFVKRRDDSALYLALQDQVGLALSWAYQYKSRVSQLEQDLRIAQEFTRMRKTLRPELPKKKEEYRRSLDDRIGQLNTLISEEQRVFDEREAALVAIKTKAEQEIDVESQTFARKDEKLSNEIRELKRQLEELKVKEIIKHEITHIHGQVLQPDIPNKIGFIDIGSRERVVPGLKFLVGKRGAQGKFEFKGKVEVKKAFTTHSEVSIIEIYDPKEHPIVEGDFLVNPLFSKERPVVVAFVGQDQAVRLRYSVDEASRRIREIGGDPRKAVSLDVDYVVFTEVKAPKPREEYPGFLDAVFLEIPIAEASDIYRFLGD